MERSGTNPSCSVEDLHDPKSSTMLVSVLPLSLPARVRIKVL
jgi:hypothetical protein